METNAFWCERHNKFAELASLHGAADLHAVRVEVDLPAELEQASKRTHAAIADPSAALESIYGHARTAIRAGRILLDGEKADRWIVSGGPYDRLARATLQRRFQSEALMASVGAGEVEAAATEQAVLEAWLDLLVRLESPHWRSFGVLEHLAHASAEMCSQLAARAYVAEAGQAVIAPSKRTAQPTRLPNRAAWLERQMASRDLSRHRLKVLGGPDHNTTDRILAGEPVRSYVVNRLAKALSVPRDQIPDWT